MRKAGLLIAVFLAAAAPAAAAGPLALLRPRAPANVSLALAAKTLTGELPVIVQSQGGGTLTGELVTQSGGVVHVATTTPTRTPPTHVELRLAPATLNAGAPTPVVVQFRLPPDATLGGTLVLWLEGAPAAALTVPVTGSPATTGDAAPQPAKVVVQVTEWLPGSHRFFYGAHAAVRVPANPQKPDGWSQSARLPSDGIRTVRATLKTDATPPVDGLSDATVKVDEIGATGAFEGAVPYGSASQTLPVTVHVRDLFVWPLLVLTLGAVLGGLVLQSYERLRRILLLVRRARAVRTKYDRARGRRPGYVPELDEPTPTEQYDGIARNAWRTWSDDGYDALFDRVDSFDKRVTRWVRLVDAARGLEVTAPPEEATKIAADRSMLLERLHRVPRNEADVDALTADAERLAQIVELFETVWADWVASGRPGRSPDGVYTPGSYASDERARDQREALETFAAQLRLTEEDLTATLDRTMEIIAERRVRVPAVVVRGWQRYTAETAERMERTVRRLDWATALTAAIITLVIAFATKYNRDFGSLQDYVDVFALGFTGQAVGAAVWSLLPPFRSYTAARATAAK